MNLVNAEKSVSTIDMRKIIAEVTGNEITREQEEFMAEICLIYKLSGYIEALSDTVTCIESLLEKIDGDPDDGGIELSDEERDAAGGALVAIWDDIAMGLRQFVGEYNSRVTDLFGGEPPVVEVDDA